MTVPLMRDNKKQELVLVEKKQGDAFREEVACEVEYELLWG